MKTRTNICECIVSYSDISNNTLNINGVEVTHQEIIENDYNCPECGGEFNIDLYF